MEENENEYVKASEENVVPTESEPKEDDAVEHSEQDVQPELQ